MKPAPVNPAPVNPAPVNSTHGKPAIRLLIVEDQVMVASGLFAVLETFPSIQPIGVAHNLASARLKAAELQPGVILLDYRLPDGLAPTVIADLRSLCDTKIVILSASSDIAAVSESLSAGANGFLLKEQPVEELVHGIERAYAGEQVIAPALMGPMLDELAQHKTRIEVTQRQRQILQMLANGNTTAQMATDLGLSVNTVRNQIHATLVRLGAHSKLEAVAIGRREHLIATGASV
jgi:DNA-binding NarL/FixJ family response regulator